MSNRLDRAQPLCRIGPTIVPLDVEDKKQGRPRSMANLFWTSESTNEDRALREEIRKETSDVYSRLHSIDEDTAFVASIHSAYPRLPLIPNLRCGAWYVDPSIAGGFAYFKSTDGHYNNWSFNLRRSNLHLLPIILEHGGMILVDSTRSGKRFPDALSKTVPIWCEVVNRAVRLRHHIAWKEESKLYTPAGTVSAQEHHQIETKIGTWAHELAASSYDLPVLTAPLRPMWLSPSTTVLPHLSKSVDFIPVLCVCSSHQTNAGFDRRSGGFTYVQGSADDHELWGGGLTPSDFWQHKNQILASSRHDLPQLISSLVDNRGTVVANTTPGNFSPSSISRVGGRIRICTLSEVPPSPPLRLLSLEESTPSSGDVSAAYILITPTTPDPPCETAPQPSPPTLSMHLAEGKKGQEQFLREILPRSMAFIRKHLNEGRIVVIACTNGKDASVGVALAAIQTFFDQDGCLSLCNQPATKDAIRTKLQWIIASRPESNPSRATLKRVNEFLLSPVGFRAWQSPAQAP